jgi:hypothetical protein
MIKLNKRITVKETIEAKVKKGKVLFLQVMNAYRRSRGTAPLVHNLVGGGS